MDIKFVVHGELSDLNTYNNAQRRHRHIGARLKREETELVWAEALAAKLQKIEIYPVFIHFSWYCASAKKDPDNISSGGRKVILDGLQMAGVIENDGWKQIAGFSDSFHIDKANPRVEMTFSVVK